MPPDPPGLACLCMHTIASDTHVTPLPKTLATGVFTHSFQPRAKLPMFQQINNEAHESQHTPTLPLDGLNPGLFMGKILELCRSFMGFIGSIRTRVRVNGIRVRAL